MAPKIVKTNQYKTHLSFSFRCAQAWGINLGDYAVPSAATKNYIDFLRRAASESSATTVPIPAENGVGMRSDQTAPANGSGGVGREADGQEGRRTEGEPEGESRSDSEARRADGAHQERADLCHHRSQEGPSSISQDIKLQSKATEAGHVLNHDAARTVAALVPCMRLYAFLGTELGRGRDLTGHPYRDWIETYASQDFQVGLA